MNWTKELIGTIDLGHHATKGGYVLLLYRSGVMVEPIVTIAEEEMRSNGVLLVFKFLRNRPRRDAKKMSYFDETTKNRLLKIKREYALITMSIVSDGGVQELKTMPLHARRGWSFDRHANEISRVKLPITNEQFLKIIDDALEIAT
jgi:hypothetical protein